MKLSDKEFEILQKKYQNGIIQVKRIAIYSFVLFLIALIIPVKVWNILILPKKQILHLPDITEPMYKNVTFIFVALIFVLLAIFFKYISAVYFVKKDLKTKEKLSGIFKVVKIKSLSKKVASKLDGLDTVLYFEKNKTRINRHLFNKTKNPEFQIANSIKIECSKYSRTIFMQELILNVNDKIESDSKIQDRYQEVKELILKYVKFVGELQLNGKDKVHDIFFNDLIEYYKTITSKSKLNENYFYKFLEKGNCSKQFIFDYLSDTSSELLSIFVRLFNLHQKPGNQIDNSGFHYKFLLENSEKPLRALGFTLKEKQEYQVEYINSKKIIVSIVYQRYDPPEVWIKRETDKNYLRLGTYVEKYFDKEMKLYKKYAGNEYGYFNYSSFNYYEEFLSLYLNKFAELGDFVPKINNWINVQ